MVWTCAEEVYRIKDVVRQEIKGKTSVEACDFSEGGQPDG